MQLEVFLCNFKVPLTTCVLTMLCIFTHTHSPPPPPPPPLSFSHHTDPLLTQISMNVNLGLTTALLMQYVLTSYSASSVCVFLGSLVIVSLVLVSACTQCFNYVCVCLCVTYLTDSPLMQISMNVNLGLTTALLMHYVLTPMAASTV